MTYNFKDPKNAPISFIEFKDANHIFRRIYNGDIGLENVEKEQRKFKSDIGGINQRNPQHKSPNHTQAISKIENLYNAREDVAKMFMNQKMEQDLKY